jgi:hypothetical protein
MGACPWIPYPITGSDPVNNNDASGHQVVTTTQSLSPVNTYTAPTISPASLPAGSQPAASSATKMPVVLPSPTTKPAATNQAADLSVAQLGSMAAVAPPGDIPAKAPSATKEPSAIDKALALSRFFPTALGIVINNVIDREGGIPAQALAGYEDIHVPNAKPPPPANYWEVGARIVGRAVGLVQSGVEIAGGTVSLAAIPFEEGVSGGAVTAAVPAQAVVSSAIIVHGATGFVNAISKPIDTSALYSTNNNPSGGAAENAAGKVTSHIDVDSTGAPEKWYTVTNADGTEPFSARVVEENGIKRVEVAWTESLPQTRNWLGQVQEAEGGAGSIRQITGKASAGLEEGIQNGRITADSIAKRLNSSLGGQWSVKFDTSNGVTNVVATRN